MLREESVALGERVLYLGHLVGNGRLCIPEERVKVVKDWPRPEKKKQLKTFLGTIGYYRKFVPNFAEYSAVLSPLTTREALDVVVWTKEGNHAFNMLRECLCKCVCLIVPQREEVGYILHTDASGVAVGGVLHVVRDG